MFTASLDCQDLLTLLRASHPSGQNLAHHPNITNERLKSKFVQAKPTSRISHYCIYIYISYMKDHKSGCNHQTV